MTTTVGTCCSVCGAEIQREREGVDAFKHEHAEAPCRWCGHLYWYVLQAAEDVQIVRFKGMGIVTEQNVMRVLDRVDQLIRNRNLRSFLFNLESVSYMSSTVLGRFMSLTKQLRQVQGRLKLCALHPDVDDMFRIARFDRFFEIFSDEASGLASFRA